MVCTGRTDEAGGLHANSVRRHRPRLLVGQQHPVLALGEAERLLLLLELQAIRVLIPRPTAPRRVATTLDLHRRGLHRGEHTGTVDSDGGIQIKVLAPHHLTVLDVDIDAWHLLGTIGQPVHMHSILATKRHHQVSILCRLNDFAAVIVGILLHLPQAELREHEVLPTCSLVQLDAQVAIAAAEVYLRALPSLGSSLRQTVVIGCERAHHLPRRTICRSIERQLSWGIAIVVAGGIAEVYAAHLLLQSNIEIRLGLIDTLLLIPRYIPCGMIERIDVAIKHLVVSLAVATRQISREHASIEFHGQRDELIGGIAPRGILHQHLFIHTLARHRYRIVAIYVEAQATLLAQLSLTTNEDACRVVAHLYRWCEPLADGTHRSGDDAIACDVSHNIREHLVVIFIVELQLHDARQTAHHLLLREGGNRVHRGLVVAKSCVVRCHHAELSVDVLRVA